VRLTFLGSPRRRPTSPLSVQRRANGVQRHCNVSVVFDEFSIATGETQEVSDVLTIFRLMPTHYHMCLIFRGVDAVLANVKATKIHFLTSPGTFCTFGFETMFRQQGKHFADMHDMFRQGTAVNHNIIQVHDDESVFHWLQDAVRHAHELAGFLCQAKWQDSPLIETKLSGEGCLQVLLCKPAGAVHGVE